MIAVLGRKLVVYYGLVGSKFLNLHWVGLGRVTENGTIDNSVPQSVKYYSGNAAY